MNSKYVKYAGFKLTWVTAAGETARSGNLPANTVVYPIAIASTDDSSDREVWILNAQSLKKGVSVRWFQWKPTSYQVADKLEKIMPYKSMGYVLIPSQRAVAQISLIKGDRVVVELVGFCFSKENLQS